MRHREREREPPKGPEWRQYREKLGNEVPGMRMVQQIGFPPAMTRAHKVGSYVGWNKEPLWTHRWPGLHVKEKIVITLIITPEFEMWKNKILKSVKYSVDLWADNPDNMLMSDCYKNIKIDCILWFAVNFGICVCFMHGALFRSE